MFFDAEFDQFMKVMKRQIALFFINQTELISDARGRAV